MRTHINFYSKNDQAHVIYDGLSYLTARTSGNIGWTRVQNLVRIQLLPIVGYFNLK